MIVTLFVAAAALLGLAIIVWNLKRVHDPVIGMLGFLLILVPLIVGRGVPALDAQDHTVHTIEDQYGINVEEYVLSETPARWRIDGDYYSCYVVDLDATDLDLRCAAHDAFPDGAPAHPDGTS